MMMLSKLKVGLAVLLSTGLVAAGSGMLAAQAPGDKPTGKVGIVTPAARPDSRLAPVVDEVNLLMLGKSRVEMARKRWETQRAFYNEGRITVDRLLNASQTLMEAELDTTEAPEARLNSLKAHLARVKEIEKNELAELEVGRATTADVEEVQTFRLEVEFRIAKEAEAAARKASTVARPADPKGLPRPDIGQERVEMARKRWETQLAFYKEGRLTIDRLLNASQTLMEAELDTNDAPEVRLTSLKSHLARVKEIEKNELAELEVGRATTADVEEVQTYRLEVEFRIAKEAEAASRKPSTVPLPADTRPADSKGISNLATERVEIARRLFDKAKRLFPAEINIEDFVNAWKTLLEAEEGAARTKAERVKVAQRQIEVLKRLVPAFEKLVNAGEKEHSDLDRLRLRILDAQVHLDELSRTPEGLGEGPAEGVTPKPNGPLPVPGPGGPATHKSETPSSLAKVIASFNRNAMNIEVGREQPPLNEDEVVASIRYPEVERNPNAKPDLPDPLFDDFRKIAETRELPQGAYFEILQLKDPGGDFLFEGWWIQIVMSKADGEFYTFPVRSRVLRSVSLEEALSWAEDRVAVVKTAIKGRGVPSGRKVLEKRVLSLKERIELRDRKRADDKAGPR